MSSNSLDYDDVVWEESSTNSPSDEERAALDIVEDDSDDLFEAPPAEALEPGDGDAAPTEPEAVEDDSVVSEDLLERARAIGLKDEAIETFDDVNSLEQFVSSFNPKREAVELSPFEYPPELSLSEEDLDPEYFEEEIVEKLKARDAHVGQAIQQRDEHIAELERQIEDSYFDSKFGSVPEAYSELLGGNKTLVQLHGQQANGAMEARQNVVETMKALESRFPDADKDALFEKALRAEFPEAELKSKQLKLSKTLKEQKGRTLHRPNQGIQTKNMSPEQRAILRVRERMQGAGGWGS